LVVGSIQEQFNKTRFNKARFNKTRFNKVKVKIMHLKVVGMQGDDKPTGKAILLGIALVAGIYFLIRLKPKKKSSNWMKEHYLYAK